MGDLDQPFFGLGEQAFAALADKVEVIIHNGAYVNGAMPYSKLAPANVEGTRTILQLATTGKQVLPRTHACTPVSLPVSLPLTASYCCLL